MYKIFDSQVINYRGFGLVTDPSYQPKVLVFDDVGIRLNILHITSLKQYVVVFWSEKKIILQRPYCVLEPHNDASHYYQLTQNPMAIAH